MSTAEGRVLYRRFGFMDGATEDDWINFLNYIEYHYSNKPKLLKTQKTVVDAYNQGNQEQ